ncbi:MAG TPA: phospholipase D-like domain-containing protein [Pseudothermotoga sp.]|nr:phospholipase D-like domain-containing protein [Pseudothermotoga sp.]HOK84276.1 phospholipase D-like domain-containing protein [Pseudothermotoga sp.]HPP70890.1 phospholipase D-like domain-containing protein [Pseudothermotoga sp.]
MKYIVLFLMISCTVLAQNAIFTPVESSAFIVDIIDHAEFSVSVCSFSIDEPKIIAALENAHRRGIKVRVISETPVESDSIPVRIDAESSLFHMKAIVVDEKTLILGSANFTTHSLFSSFNDILVIEDANLAFEFQQFFDDLWEGIERKVQFSGSKILIKNFELEQTVLEQICKASKTLDIAMYAMTHPQVWAALKILSSRGIHVRVLSDEWFFKNSSLSKLPFTGIQLKVIKDFTLHSKLFIIDGRTVVTGSANATKSGYSSNAEMLIIVEDKRICQEYVRYFERIWTEGVEP